MTGPAATAILQDPAFLKELEDAAQGSEKTTQQSLKYAAKCLKEIEATPRDAWQGPMAKMARFIYTRSYEAKLDINTDAVDELRRLSENNLLVFLWSHKSHMDSFVFLLSLYEQKFRPLPLIFAGINMNFIGFGSLARRVGAIFLRRSFSEDPVYKLVFRRYIDYLIRNKMPLSWSIEGTRSRTGKLSPPKLGILNWVAESCHREDMKDVLLVPVSIAFDRIAEIDDYVAIQAGKPKRKESLRWFIDYVFGMRKPYGKVYVRYGEPLRLEDAPSFSQGLLQGETDPRLTEVPAAAFEVCRRIEQITPIKSADVLTMVLLGANRRALTITEIHRQACEISELITERELPAASSFSLQNETEVAAALLVLEDAGLVACFSGSAESVYYIERNQQLAAAYYRNTITHYFMCSAMAEIALAMCAHDIDAPCEASLRRNVMSLRDLYKFEFFYKSSEAFWQEVLFETHKRYPGWDAGEHSLQKLLRARPPRFGHAILRSISEAYLVIAVTLLEFGDEAIQGDKALTKRLLAQGEQMLLRRSISCDASVSQDLFATGLRLARYLEILGGRKASGGMLIAAREAFAERVMTILAAINLLQRCYDSSWSPETLAGKATNLLES